ncbi:MULTISPECIES: TetR/AcrR family transcriptional regulator [Actinosynnema]|uniref:TetR/AcrR family transcriptional regulator n=1 Tax=Actinosynnema TaxID=40566 RepID=UPI0020A33EEE|nr:TetR/AcrR family transcriptional regulator [Actinosynnema pretiosum]MCP2093914.1 transcriptional regulator, TetR family [Actinosynnema pretiosum]
MPRPVDPARHRAKRLQIIDAGLTAFAEHGYAGATTATICKVAKIGSGTFFHYFPTKDSLLVAILELGTAETRDFFAAQEGRTDHRAVVLDYVTHAVADLADPRAGGFIAVVGGLIANADVAQALRADELATREGLLPWVERARDTGQTRRDLDAPRLTEWVLLLVDGIAGRIAGGTPTSGFTVDQEIPVLLEQVNALLDGPTR